MAPGGEGNAEDGTGRKMDGGLGRRILIMDKVAQENVRKYRIYLSFFFIVFAVLALLSRCAPY